MEIYVLSISLSLYSLICMPFHSHKSDSPKHKGLVYGRFEVEDVIGHCQVVFQSEGLQHDAIPHWEGKP